MAIRSAIILVKLSSVPVMRGYLGNMIGVDGNVHTMSGKLCILIEGRAHSDEEEGSLRIFKNKSVYTTYVQ